MQTIVFGCAKTFKRGTGWWKIGWQETNEPAGVFNQIFCQSREVMIRMEMRNRLIGTVIVNGVHRAQLLHPLLWFIIIVIIYPLTTRVVGHHRCFHNQFPQFSPVLHCPLGFGELQACPFPNVVFPPPFKMGLARPDERVTCPYHCSLRLFTMVMQSSCGPIACWISARTSSLVTWSLYEMHSIIINMAKLKLKLQE